MSRVNRMTSGNTNPAEIFIQWSSKNQKFLYYDKENKANVLIDMPFKFLAISKYITVTGWNQKKEQSIISNEVKNIDDTLVVNAYKKGGNGKELIVEGDWKSISDKMEMEKGKFTQSVYAMLPDGKLVNIKLSGASLSTWFEFQKNQTDRFFNDWVIVNGFKEGVNGSVQYTYPVFEWGTSLDESSQKRAEVADAKVLSYEEGYFGKKNEPVEAYRERSEVDKHEMNSNKPPVPPSHVDAELAMHEAVSSDDDLPF
jgi:hypothetical protein